MSVVGFDFGNLKSVVSIARRGGIDVLQNEVGNRSTPSMVAFSGRERFIGNEALAQYMSNPANSVNNLKRLIGRRFDDSEIASEQRQSYFKVVEMPSGLAGVDVNYDDKREQFSPEQLTGALLTKLKAIAERGLDGQKVADCVIGCPSWWGDQQRRALLDSASIAGLNVLRMMNETTAIALNYGLLRPLPKDKEQKVLFFDLGHSSLNVSLVSFVEGKLTVLGSACDRNLGGRDFDELLVAHFVELIKTKYKMDVSVDVKAMLKLRKECERVKLHLSANSKVQFNVEYIMNDRDVSAIIERTEFETLAAQVLLPRLMKPIEEVLTRCGVKKEELSSIEVVGGSVRIPAVQKALVDYFGREISKTCDGDESVARGCALMCAMISPSFKVREFEVADISPYPIQLQWGPVSQSLDGWKPEDSTDLFTTNNPIPSVKLISFNDRVDPFQLVARYSQPELLPPTVQPLIGRFLISGQQKDANKKAPKIKVRVKINQHGVLAVTSAQSIEEIIEPVEQKMEDATIKEAAATDAAAPVESPTSGDAKMETAPDSAAPAVQTPQPVKTRVKREELKVETFYFGGIDQKLLQLFFEREAAMANQDRVIFETNESRNSLESYILEMRNALSDSLREFVKDDDKQKFNDLLDSAESWLYGDGSEAQKSDYKKKLGELKAVGDPIQLRLFEFENREHGVQALKSAIGHGQLMAQTKEEKFSHIAEDERKKITDECAKVDQWLVAALIAADKQAKADNPTLTVAELKSKKDALEKFTNQIMNKQKPAPPKPAPAPAAEPAKPAAAAENKTEEKKPEETPAAEKPMDTTQ